MRSLNTYTRPTPLARRIAGRVTAFFAIAALASMPALAQNIVTNGGFETGDFTGFTVNSPSGLTSVGYDSPHSGSFAAGFGSFLGQESISQALTTSPGQMYNISFWALNPTQDGTNSLMFAFGGTQFTPTNVNDVYTQFMFSGVATGNSTMLQIFGENSADRTHVDDISVSAAGMSTVPEPSSLALLGTGLVGLVPIVRRKLS